MPRQPCRDALAARRHGTVRGIERTALVRDDPARADVIARAAHLAEPKARTVYATTRPRRGGDPRTDRTAAIPRCHKNSK